MTVSLLFPKMVRMKWIHVALQWGRRATMSGSLVLRTELSGSFCWFIREYMFCCWTYWKFLAHSLVPNWQWRQENWRTRVLWNSYVKNSVPNTRRGAVEQIILISTSSSVMPTAIANRRVSVGAESDQHVNICSFAVCCDRRWPNTQWHRVYTGSGNVPYVQFESIDDFIPEPRCS